VIFALAEVLRPKELGQADQCGAIPRSASDKVGSPVKVLLDRWRTGHLDQRNPRRLHCH
jgi:hypothetical protein